MTVMKVTARHSAVWALLVVLWWWGPAAAITVAVFPMDDLSSGHNTMNRGMTEFLRHEIGQHGVTVVAAQEVEAFMAARRIRHLGALQSEEVKAARTDLQADLVLLASLCQYSETSVALGMTVSLLRTTDGRTIWTSSKGVSLVDEQRLLGIKAPTTVTDLLPILARDLFATWPADLQATAGLAQADLQVAAGREDGAIEVDSVFFSPKYVRPGQEVKCTIRFKARREIDTARVYIRVGNRIHMATSDDGIYYQVTWVGSEERIGKPVQVAMNSPDARVVSGMWSGDRQDADYPVSLILEWPSGKREESYLGAYVVDSQAPAVIVKTQGKTINGATAFRNELPIAVLFKRSEPIARWEFAVSAPDGEVLLNEKGTDLPPAQFTWRGQNDKNSRADVGLYVVSMKAWDRAGNMGLASEQVRLLAAKPGVNLVVESCNQELRARLTALDPVAVAFWRLELWGADNSMLGAYEGQTLPALVPLPALTGGGDAKKIDCVLQVRDALGSQATRKIPDLLAQVVAEPTTVPATSPAGRSSNDSDLWRADF